ncbi:hypothetical protein ACFO1S_17300 [Cohnella boryungensis]|uniref:Uncharacterized protein n=1 Tax=Cohnella boryungensis TaxID=768479 RepID=A0ABV8SCB0_9BACL
MTGKLFPDTPMFSVNEDDLVKMKIINRSPTDHPMHRTAIIYLFSAATKSPRLAVLSGPIR